MGVRRSVPSAVGRAEQGKIAIDVRACSSEESGATAAQPSAARTRPGPTTETGRLRLGDRPRTSRSPTPPRPTPRAGWRRTTAVARGEILRRAADLLEARVDEAARRLVADIGKPIRDARAEALRACAILRYHAGEALQPGGRDLSERRRRHDGGDPLGAGRRRLRAHPVELPARDPRLEAGAGAGLRQPGRLEAGDGRLGLGGAAGRDPGRGRGAARGAQPAHRARAPSSRRRSPATPARGADLHRLGGDRPRPRPGGRRARRQGAARARRQEPGDRARRRRPRRRRRAGRAAGR